MPKNNYQIIIPDGWRALATGETRRDGDQFFQNGKWQLSCLSGYTVTSQDPIVIRNIKNDNSIIPIKKKNFFNPFSIIPSRMFGVTQSTSDKVKEYLKKVQSNAK